MHDDWSRVADERNWVANKAWRICRSQASSIRWMIVVIACRLWLMLFRLRCFGRGYVGVVWSHIDVNPEIGRVG